MTLSWLKNEKLLKELQVIFEKEYKKKLTRAETEEIGNNLVNYFELLIEVDQRQKNAKRQGDKRIQKDLQKDLRSGNKQRGGE